MASDLIEDKLDPESMNAQKEYTIVLYGPFYTSFNG